MDVKSLSQQFEKVITQQAAYQSSNIGCNMLIARMVRQYSNSPTKEQLEKCVGEMCQFFEKYQSIMATDIEILKSL